jgi:hypothetical protein
MNPHKLKCDTVICLHVPVWFTIILIPNLEPYYVLVASVLGMLDKHLQNSACHGTLYSSQKHTTLIHNFRDGDGICTAAVVQCYGRP